MPWRNGINGPESFLPAPHLFPDTSRLNGMEGGGSSGRALGMKPTCMKVKRGVSYQAVPWLLGKHSSLSPVWP